MIINGKEYKSANRSNIGEMVIYRSPAYSKPSCCAIELLTLIDVVHEDYTHFKVDVAYVMPGINHGEWDPIFGKRVLLEECYQL